MADTRRGYIKLYRSIDEWRWFKNSKVFHVFVWLLIHANIKEGYFEKDKIKRGSIATSNESIANGCGLSIQSVRTVLANLEETEEIERTPRNHYQIIRIINYEKYQTGLPKTVGQLTTNHDSNQQATVMATNNNQRNKEYKNVKNKELPPISPIGGESPSGMERGTDEFRNQSHLLLKPEEGTADDIPERYREICDNNFAVYWGMRNQ